MDNFSSLLARFVSKTRMSRLVIKLCKRNLPRSVKNAHIWIQERTFFSYLFTYGECINVVSLYVLYMCARFSVLPCCFSVFSAFSFRLAGGDGVSISFFITFFMMPHGRCKRGEAVWGMTDGYMRVETFLSCS